MAAYPEEMVLRVRAATPAKDLAAAISHGIYDGRRLVLRAIGAGAVCQAVKAVAIAGSLVAARGLTISCRPGFQDVEMPDGITTAITIRVFAD